MLEVLVDETLDGKELDWNRRIWLREIRHVLDDPTATLPERF